LGKVDRVSSLAQDFALRAFLSALGQKGADILEIVGRNVRRKRLGRRQRDAVAGEHITDLPLRDGNQLRAVHAVLKRHEEMEAAAQYLGLETRLAGARDEAVWNGAVRAPQFFQHAKPIVGDVTDRVARHDEQRHQCEADHDRGQRAAEDFHGISHLEKRDQCKRRSRCLKPPWRWRPS
jgi:hypothetical protein